MIRLATLEDIPAVMALLERFHAEHGEAPMNRHKVEREVVALVDLCDLFVAEEDSAIVGALGLVHNEYWYSDRQRIDDRFLYVVPEHRPTIGQMLLRAGALEAERRHLSLYVTSSNRAKARQRGRVCEITGFYPAGHQVRLR